jgi:hypothetical protein
MEEILKPITKAEVEAAAKNPFTSMITSRAASDFITFDIGPASPEYWLGIGYEIARARHQSAETKWENAKAHFERHAKRMGASWALDIMKQEDEAEKHARVRAEKGEEL